MSSPKPNQVVSNNSGIRRARRLNTVLTILLPLAGTIAAIVMLPWLNIGVLEIAMLIAMWLISGTGITVGFHRHFAHRAFKTSTAVRMSLLIMGCMAGQGPLIYWVALHRRHHQYSDSPSDPHSPHIHGDRSLKAGRGLWHAHTGWIFEHEIPNPGYYAPDLLRDQTVVKMNRLYLLWFVVGLIIPTILSGIAHHSWAGALTGLLWGGFVRVFVTQNAIWSVNSLGHFAGGRPFDTGNRSTNSFWFAVPTLGESWHNNHHAFSNSAFLGLYWWQLDWGGLIVRILYSLGLIWDVRFPGNHK